MDERSTLHVDCDSCSARGPACEDCVVSVLLGMPGPRVDLDGDEQQALSALAGSGLVPPLRLVPRARPARSVAPPRYGGWDGGWDGGWQGEGGDGWDEPGDPSIRTRFVTGSEG